MNNIIIRQENQNDYKNIYDLVKKAFETARVSDGHEQEFVNELRNSNNYIKELALLAEDNGKLVGHTMLTKKYINTRDGKVESLLLAPLCVALEYRDKGVGSKLVNQSFKLARKMGYKSVILLGDPNYYKRFGFRKSIDLGIKNLNNIEEKYVQVCELVSGSLNKINGTIKF